jgi:hypothetical protein
MQMNKAKRSRRKPTENIQAKREKQLCDTTRDG